MLCEGTQKVSESVSGLNLGLNRANSLNGSLAPSLNILDKQDLRQEFLDMYPLGSAIAHKVRAATIIANQSSTQRLSKKRKKTEEDLDDDLLTFTGIDAAGKRKKVTIVRELEGWTGVERVRWGILAKLCEVIKSYSVYLLS